MYFKKIIIVNIALIVSFSIVYAQNSQQIKILNNYGEIPFEDGKTVIKEINFTGVDNNFEIRKNLGETRTKIDAGDFFYGTKISKAVKSIQEYLISEGYNKAEITALGEELPKNQMKLIFSIKQGNLATVSEIKFEGNHNLTDQEILKYLKNSAGDSWKIWYDRKYEYYTQKYLREYYLSKGYLNTRIKSVFCQTPNDRNFVRIEIEEGLRFRFGQIELEGSRVFSKEQILSMLGQKTGNVANLKDLRDFFEERLSSLYKNNGYLQYDTELDPEYITPKVIGQDGIVNLKIIIDEGKQFRIRRISIECDEPLKIQKIKKMLGLNEGEIFNQEKFENGITRINKTKEFKFVDKDRDLRIWSDEESNDIDLIIKISKK